MFEAAITPYRSLSPRGQRLLMLLLTALLLLGTGGFAFAGAWPVGGFAVVELLGAIVLLRWHARRMQAGELIILTRRDVRIIRTDGAGRRRERLLPAAWLSVAIEERPGRSPALLLTGRGQREEIATDLGEAERRALGRALADALDRLRHPVFDNPVLRDGPSEPEPGTIPRPL